MTFHCRSVTMAGNGSCADGLAGLDIAQMLDRNAGLERQISLAHGPAIALAAQEIADGIDLKPGLFRRTRIHPPIMRRQPVEVNTVNRAAPFPADGGQSIRRRERTFSAP